MRDDSHALPTESNAAERVLAELGAEFCGHAVDLEFSLRLRPKAIEPSGRFACWLAGEAGSDFAPIARALRRLDAPACVLSAQQTSERPVRQGIAAAIGPDGPEFRLYLHGRDRTGRDTYQAWRWGTEGAVSRSVYEFHFLPETPEGVAPLDLTDVALRPAVAMLLADERVQQMSGFWLRRAADGTLEQLDLIFPWHPRAGDLPGLLAIAEHFALPLDHPSDWRSLPIRHIAFAIGRPAVTLYASAPLREPWPQTEGALQRAVRQGASRLNRDIERQFFEKLPSRATARPEGEMLDRFYGGAIATWRQILGAELHYHAGLFDTPDSDDEAMMRALRRAVTELYPFIPAGGSVYDIGCGWGGPLSMWTRDLQCHGLGLTISRTQFRHVASLGLPARWGDAERTLPPGVFDCAIMLESFCHVADKARLLAVLRLFASRLVMRVNCQDGAPAARAFGDTMHMISSERLRELLGAAGWRVNHWRDRRPEALPSVRAWSRRLAEVSPTDDRHIETLREWCARVLQDPEAWGAHNPLIEVVCE